MPDNLFELPKDLPVPIDDGACVHLLNTKIPAVCLPATNGRDACLAKLNQWTVLYCYPLTGRPDSKLPDGWDQIPGARGCTAEACAFRDHYSELQAFGTQVFGLSTQTTTYQQEVVERLHIPFELLSDADLILTQALHLPTFEADGMILLKRLTLILSPQGQIEKVFYPVFTPAHHPNEVIAWLSVHL